MRKDKKEGFFQEASLIRWMKLISKGPDLQSCFAPNMLKSFHLAVLSESCFSKYKNCSLCSQSELFRFYERQTKKKEKKSLMKTNMCNCTHFIGVGFNCLVPFWGGGGGADGNSNALHLKGNILKIFAELSILDRCMIDSFVQVISH